jgi:hypothetical protein
MLACFCLDSIIAGSSGRSEMLQSLQQVLATELSTQSRSTNPRRKHLPVEFGKQAKRVHFSKKSHRLWPALCHSHALCGMSRLPRSDDSQSRQWQAVKKKKNKVSQFLLGQRSNKYRRRLTIGMWDAYISVSFAWISRKHFVNGVWRVCDFEISQNSARESS